MIVFDFCGVLGDWPTDADRMRLQHRAGRSGDDFWNDYWQHRPAYDIGGLDDREYWSRVAPGVADVAGLVEADVAGWTRLRRGALALVEELPGPKAILSNAPAGLARAIDAAPWAGRFATRLFSAGIGVAKPDGAAYRILCERLGLPPGDLVFVDDRPENVAAARAHGLRGVHFTGLSALHVALR